VTHTTIGWENRKAQLFAKDAKNRALGRSVISTIGKLYKPMIKKTALLYTISMVVGLYTTFVLTILWSWFVVPAFHVATISFWVMYGLTMLIDLLRSPGDIEVEHRHKIVAVMLDACVPAEKRQDVTEQLSEFTERLWYEAGWKVFGQMFANTMTLGLGFVVHTLAS
jgi:hypothetical protein